MFYEIKVFSARNVGLDEGDIKAVTTSVEKQAAKYLEKFDLDVTLIPHIISTNTNLVVEGNYVAFALTLTIEINVT